MATLRPQPSLKGRALRLLSQREHSRLELERKLAEHETEPGQLAKALDELQARGFISEERVIESVIHRRAGKLGTARVKQELAAKGLSGEAVTEAMEQLRGTELARLACAQQPQLSVILMSGYVPDPSDIKPGWLFIRKPMDTTELLGLIKAATPIAA